MKNEMYKNISIVIIFISFFLFLYASYKALIVVNETQIRTPNGIYSSYISRSEEIQQKARALTKNCSNTLCSVEAVLDFVTAIPYVTNTFQKCTPKKTIEQKFGDCDDKSNLLISLLHVLNIEAYFVLVPKHIFVIVRLSDTRLSGKKGLWVNQKKYYILESTVKNSKVGFPFQYKLEEINAIIDPFKNEKKSLNQLEYKL